MLSGSTGEPTFAQLSRRASSNHGYFCPSNSRTFDGSANPKNVLFCDGVVSTKTMHRIPRTCFNTTEKMNRRESSHLCPSSISTSKYIQSCLSLSDSNNPMSVVVVTSPPGRNSPTKILGLCQGSGGVGTGVAAFAAII